MATVSTKIDAKLTGKTMFTTAEAADILGLNRDTLRHYCQGETPKIKGVKFGRDWLIPKAEVDRYDRERREVGRPPGDE